MYCFALQNSRKIPLPDKQTRFELLTILLKGQNVNLSEEDVSRILELTAHYSGSDLKVLCKEAAMGPVDGSAPRSDG